ncbi:MAG: hypothetical protein A2494_00205 [Candidatus Lloydbacteria bacterium RIFOXYC12_FULL_46_25]|uniref:Response regulatory domain-containing protein n=1 Tax=Candidatus Lloydbacteria bacterium RIFOXYC12_FULL_46_25 TaxID=1798670 RepID=A0A1G2DUB1_9BACT|nr:MAG: hypothetical protein A2494_00205 [Candidatus Lloydbacteria bacterium RIFOXYC12_FULL_46_25]
MEPKKILIVEDDAVLLQMLANVLRQHDFIVFEAQNGIEGITHIKSDSPDLVLLDIDMPQMGGLFMLKTIRANGDKTPVIMLTNVNNPNSIADAAEFGVSAYLVKSDWEIDDIVKKIKGQLHINS